MIVVVMKIIVVCCNEWVNDYPPVINIVNCLLNNGHTVKLIVKDYNEFVKSFKGDFSYYIIENKKRGRSFLKKLYVYFHMKIKYFHMRKYLKKIADNYDAIWTVTDETVVHTGNLLLKHKHIMSMMELMSFTPCSKIFQFIPFNMKKYAQKAFKVVVPEYNRAHIQRTLWNLVNLPMILPNKPYNIFQESKFAPNKVIDIMKQMKKEKRKIILYQGGFYPDRDLDVIAKAVSQKNNSYCLYIMGNNNDYSEYLCKKYPDVVRLPFVNSPFHMLVTKYAYVGLLPYKPAKTLHCHILNAVYCAPNKIFEYAGCGLPMIGTNVAGLDIPFREFNMGCTYENNVDSVLDALSKIEENYDEMSKNAYRFYESVDLDKIVTSIIEDGK